MVKSKVSSHIMFQSNSKQPERQYIGSSEALFDLVIFFAFGRFGKVSCDLGGVIFINSPPAISYKY